MNPVQIIQSLMNTDHLQKASSLSLKPGQLLYGRVVKFFPNETAMIQIGSARVFAQLKASLTTDDSYWFEVRSNGEDGVNLKVVEGKGQNIPADFLLKHFQIPETKQNQQLVQSFLSNHIPFTKEQLKAASSWFGHTIDKKENTALEWMIKKDLPFTKQTFQALVSVQDKESVSQQLMKLATDLDDPAFSSLKTVQSLKEGIATILANHTVDEVSTGIEAKQLLKAMIHSLGLTYENDVQVLGKVEGSSDQTLQSLKPLVMGAMSELGTKGQMLDPLLDRLTGLQLISQDFSGQMEQLVMQLPLTINHKQADVTLQWNGRKTKSGQIDPDYCRIFFCLDLQSLHQTVIDMQIQHKVIHVSIVNDAKDIASIVSALAPDLADKLKNIGYQLSYVHVVPPVETSQTRNQLVPDLFSQELYPRVDVKI